MRDTEIEPTEESVTRAREDAVAPRSEPAGSGRGRRPVVWLTTVSTVVAVATGMFTLRDQISPKETGSAQASIALYQQLVGDVCSRLNEAEQNRVKNARALVVRLRGAQTTVALRNALLDSTNQVLQPSEQELGQFEGLDVPSEFKSRADETAAAWGRIVKRLAAYAQSLDAVTTRGDLLAAVETLPATRTALADDGVTRAAGLSRLGSARCTLAPPSAIPTITLPGTTRSVIPLGRATSSPKPASPSASGQRTVGPNVGPTGDSPVGPNVAPPERRRPPGF